jgi:hypothetical protein
MAKVKLEYDDGLPLIQRREPMIRSKFSEKID